MKIIHTSDWHIGKLVHGVHMTQDQGHILKELIELIKKEEADVLIIAGDVYDRSVPPIEAVELLDEILTEIVTKYGVKVMVIAGNHDSPDRVGFASQLLRDKGLFISGHIQQHIEPITLEDDLGLIDFYLVPYAEPSIVREVYGRQVSAKVDECSESVNMDKHAEQVSEEGQMSLDDLIDKEGTEGLEIKTHDDAMKVIMDGIRENMDRTRRNVCVSHCYATGSSSDGTDSDGANSGDTDDNIVSESVRPLSIGGSETVDVSYFEGFDYVALGHLHRPQKVKEAQIRYAGSLLKYSFSEAIQKKSIPVVDLGADGAQIELKELEPVRDMRIIRGHLADLIDAKVYSLANTEDYIMAVLADQGELIDPFAELRSVYPNLLSVDRELHDREAGEDKTMVGQNFKEKNPGELFGEFYEDISGKTLTEDKATVVSEVIEGLMMKRRHRG